jgi:hypothetical protein
MKNHILSDDYRRALEYCLQPTFRELPDSKAIQQPKLIRRSIYDNIVIHLESTIAKSRTNQEIFEALDLSQIMQSPYPMAPNPPARPASDCLRQPTNMASLLQLIQPDDNIVVEIKESFELFYNKSKPQLNQEQVLFFSTFKTSRLIYNFCRRSAIN